MIDCVLCQELCHSGWLCHLEWTYRQTRWCCGSGVTATSLARYLCRLPGQRRYRRATSTALPVTMACSWSSTTWRPLSPSLSQLVDLVELVEFNSLCCMSQLSSGIGGVCLTSGTWCRPGRPTRYVARTHWRRADEVCQPGFWAE